MKNINVGNNYTIPRNNRELQLNQLEEYDAAIIPYQEIIGNYSQLPLSSLLVNIIPYQEIIGNYSHSD